MEKISWRKTNNCEHCVTAFNLGVKHRWKPSAPVLSFQRDTAKTEIAQRKHSMMRTSGVRECFPKKAGNRLETFHIAEERT